MARVNSDQFKARKPISPRTKHAILTYRGWDAFERAHGGPDIIDFDLSTFEGSAAFSSRREILYELSKLYDQLDGVTGEEEFLRARVQGSISYLRVLMGQQIPFPEYLKDTLGLIPKPFSDKEVENARNEVIRHLEPLNLTLRAKDRKRFENQLLIHDPNEIKRGIVGNQEVWLQRLSHAGIPVPKQLPFSVQFAEVDAYWSNWISGSTQKGITLVINLHARRRYDKGRPLILCLHEICGHAVQMSIWRKLIAEGTLDQICGITTVHSPETIVSEGLGQTVPDLLSDESFPAEFHLSRALQYHTLIVLHNAHLKLYQNVPIEDVLDYASSHLPFANPETFEQEILDRGTNPLFRSYLLSYAIGEQTIKKLIRRMSQSQKRSFFLEMYTKPLTPSQLMEIGNTIGP
jgi:hypothetical protein